MPRRITPQTTLDNLKKEAKRWLKALRDGDANARARFERAIPGATSSPRLRDVQHALAREYELPGWIDLTAAIDSSRGTTQGSAREETREAIAARFLEYACPDHHVRGRPAHRVARHAGLRLLQRHPDLAHEDLYTAVVCGEVDDVARALREHPELANARRSGDERRRGGAGGSFGFLDDMGAKTWEPLLFLCFSRLPLDQVNDNAVAIARLLLERGANPNAYFPAGGSSYTPLTGVVGEGEEDRPPHPRRDELARVLLEHGAEPYDMQVVYNLGFHGRVLWFLKLIHEFSLKGGRHADWDDPEWRMLDMGGYGSGARWHLRVAVENNDVELAEWCLAHGANPNTAVEKDERFPRHSLYEHALRQGHIEVAEALARGGAVRTSIVLDGEAAFVAACLRMDRPEIDRMLAASPEYARSPKAIFAAAERDRADVVDLLLALGTPIEIEDERKQRPLHIAAANDALRVADLLITRGAEIDPVEENWGNTPIDFAVYHELPRMADYLARYTRDVGNLVFLGKVDRLRELLREEPGLARKTWGSSPLFWLPDDERAAAEVVDLLLAHGADPAYRDRAGRTAADVARRRGLRDAAERLERAAGGEGPRRRPSVEEYERVAEAFVSAFGSGDEPALSRLRAHFNLQVTVDDVRAFVWRRVYNVRQRSSEPGDPYLTLDEARELVARESGFGNWPALIAAAAAGRPAPGPTYQVDHKDNKIAPRRALQPDEWDVLLGVMKEKRITALDANGQMTDTLLARVADLDHVIALHLGGSRALTDEGLHHLARMPQLQELSVTGAITDRGLEVLRELPNLRTFAMWWQQGVTDAGAAHLASCDRLESVDLMGTHTGDGAIRALARKPHLRRLKTGRLVTDEGVRMLHDLPVFKTWRDGELEYSLMEAEAKPNQLLLDGPITNGGLAALAGLEGLFALAFFWHVTALTSDGLGALAQVPNLGHLGCGGELCDDTAMRHIGALPRLRMLQGQNTVATDEGFEALSRSRTLEYFWGRECPNFTSRGFTALSRIPTLRGLGVSCAKVDDAALAMLPMFPSLRELMPMDVQDDGFRHVGACEHLEHLWMMYCRDTTDVATERIKDLARLKTYYAGRTRITDRSLEILSTMTSLERLTFWETAEITDEGVRLLARLPRLRELSLDGLPRVTPDALQVFPPGVRVSYMP